MTENVDAKQKFSKDRGLRDILGAIENVINKVMRYCGWDTKYRFEFCGLDPKDASEMSKLAGESVRRDKTINELRAERDDKPIKYGDVILDPSWLNYVQQEKMSEQQQQQGGGMEDFGGDEGGEDDYGLDESEKKDMTNQAIQEVMDERKGGDEADKPIQKAEVLTYVARRRRQVARTRGMVW
jgi:hypothetical protein